MTLPAMLYSRFHTCYHLSHMSLMILLSFLLVICFLVHISFEHGETISYFFALPYRWRLVCVLAEKVWLAHGIPYLLKS